MDRRPRPAGWWVASLLFFIGLVALTFAARSALADAIDAMRSASVGALVAAFALLVLARGGLALTAWTRLSRELARIDYAAAAQAWMRSAAAKYVPGGVWQSFSALDLLRHAGAATGEAFGVVVMDAAAAIVGGLVVGLPAIPALISEQRGTALWLLLALPALTFLHPNAFPIVLRILRRFSNQAPTVEIPTRLVMTTTALHVGSWILTGVSLSLVLSSLNADAPITLAVPVSALSWLIGFLVLIAPAGIGAREAAMVTLLAPSVGQEAAIAASLLSRAMFIAVDAGATLLALAIRKRSHAR